MTRSAPDRRAIGFFVGFLVAALLIAGGLSYFASSAPDGLDSVTLNGCVLNADGEPEGGTCIAQNAQDSATAGSPLADYAVGGGEGTTGLAGVLGVLACLVIGGGLFWVLRRRPARPAEDR
jgi:cobalt/nickel transport protein